jgi:polyhydroxybutyrate depolymerase
MRYIILVLLLLVGFGCNREFKGEGKSSRDSFTFDGEKRKFRVYLPEDYDENELHPVVIALHGRLGRGRQIEKSSLFNPIADENNVIMVYPDGYKRSWNDGRGEGPAADDNIDDVGFINALINLIIGDYGVDDSRIYVCGMSNGGFMSMRLAHELNNRIAAFGSVTGSLGVNYNGTLDQPVPVMLIAGTEDPLVPYTGGEVADSDTYSIGFEDLLEYYASNNACTTLNVEELPEVNDDGINTEKWTYTDCDNNAKCILFKNKGAGHTWPSGKSSLGENTVGKESSEIDASRELMNFFLLFEL